MCACGVLLERGSLCCDFRFEWFFGAGISFWPKSEIIAAWDGIWGCVCARACVCVGVGGDALFIGDVQ